MKITNNTVRPLDNNLDFHPPPPRFCISRAWSNLFSSTIEDSVAEVYEKISIKNTRREAEIKRIVVDGVCTVSFWNILWQIAGVGLGVVGVLLGFVFWPSDNVFMEPQKWYQCVLQCGSVWTGQYNMVIRIHYASQLAPSVRPRGLGYKVLQ